MDFRHFFTFLLGSLCLSQSSEAQVTGWTAPASISRATGAANATAIAENVAVGTILFTATATSTGAVKYSLTNNGTGKGTINSTSGVVILAKGQSIDYETTHSLQFVVVATTSSGANGTATITLPITDVNDVPPAFSSATNTACINDNSPAGTTLGTYTATDPDTGNTIAYSIASGNTKTDFAVNRTTGVITVAPGKTLSNAKAATYALIVKAVDNAALTGSTTISVTVGGCSGTGAFTALMSLVFAAVAASQLR